MPPRQCLLLVLLAFAALYVIWGSTYLARKVAIAELPPLPMAGSRSIVAGGVLLGCLAVFGKVRASDLLRPLHWRSAFLIGAVTHALRRRVRRGEPLAGPDRRRGARNRLIQAGFSRPGVRPCRYLVGGADAWSHPPQR